MRYGFKVICAMGMMSVAVIGARCDDVSQPVNIPVCGKAPVMDGNPTDASWQAALAVTNFVIINQAGLSPASNVTAKLMCDNEWLYIGFDIKHPMPDKIVPRARHRDELVQRENCVKVALDPGTEGKLWYLVRLSAGNVISDQLNSGAANEPGYNIPLRSATRITKTGWQAEIALPLLWLMKEGNPEKAKLNLLAYTFTPVLDASAVQIGEDLEAAGWAPTTAEWWKTELFIPIRVLDRAGFKEPFLPMLEDDAQVGGYALAGGKYAFNVSGHIRNAGSRAGRVTIRVRDMPATGEPSEVLQPLDIRGGAVVAWQVTVPVQSVVRRTINVDMVSETGEVLGRIQPDAPAVLEPFSALLDRNYYTTETEAGVVCRIGLPVEGLNGTRLMVRTDKGELLGETREVHPKTCWSFSLQKLKEGAHQLHIEFRRGDALISDQAVTLLKRAPKPGCEWKLDPINRVLLKNGKPFFPYGIIMYGSEDCFKNAAEIGFNTVHTWSWGRKPEDATNYVAYAEKYGLYTVVNLDGFAQGMALEGTNNLLAGKALSEAKEVFKNPSPKKVNAGLIYNQTLNTLPAATKVELLTRYFEHNKPAFANAIARLASSPNLIGYFLFDEPITLSHIFGRLFYEQVNAVDGYHPVFVVYSSHIPPGDEWVDWMDGLGTDQYWTPGGSGIRGTVNFVSIGTWLTKQRADCRGQLTWIMPMAEYWSGIRKRAILPKEQYCQTYLAIIHGAKAIIYFRWPLLNPISREAHATMAKQMRLLGPIAVTPDIEQVVSYQPGRFDPRNNECPDVQVALRRNPEGGYVLLAANSRYYPVDVTFRIASWGATGTVQRLFATNTLPVRDGAFSDSLEFLGTRAYLLPGASRLAEPVQIEVKMVAHPDQTDPVYSAPGYPDTGRPGKKNIIRNPGFEETSLPGWPDYYMTWLGNHTTTESPFEGRQCMSVMPGHGVHQACSPKVNEPTDYVLSAYMRASKEGVKAKFYGSGWLVPENTFGNKAFTLTTQWQRYWEKGKLPKGLPTWHTIGVDIPGTQKEKGTVFIDALQFEKGQEPTAYEP